jgi:hypothetical protein
LPHLAQALEDNTGLAEKRIETQFKELILKPLAAVWRTSSPKNEQAAIVIDTPDECERRATTDTNHR